MVLPIKSRVALFVIVTIFTATETRHPYHVLERTARKLGLSRGSETSHTTPKEGRTPYFPEIPHIHTEPKVITGEPEKLRLIKNNKHRKLIR